MLHRYPGMAGINPRRPGRLLPVFLVMTKSSIVFLDSGIGGLPYLSWIKNRCPNLSVSYLADTGNFPYGELQEAQVKEAAVGAAKLIFSRLSPDILALVCNTASVAALEDIRRIAPCPVVGTVPALKPAAQGGGGGAIGLLATQGTINSPYVDRLVEDFAAHREIVRVAAGDIVRYVEEDWLDDGGHGAEAVMRRGLAVLKEAGIESLVIGCTHFLHVLESIKEQMGRIRVIDSRDGVGRRILSFRVSGASSPVKGRFFVSQGGRNEGRYRRFAEFYGLEWAGILA